MFKTPKKAVMLYSASLPRSSVVLFQNKQNGARNKAEVSVGENYIKIYKHTRGGGGDIAKRGEVYIREGRKGWRNVVVRKL